MSEQTPPSERRLTRPLQGRMIAGVAAGLAQYTGWDPVLFRLGFVALAVMGGSGVLIYLVAALLIPSVDGGGRSRGSSGIARTILVVIAFFIGAQIVFAFLGAGLGFYGFGGFGGFDQMAYRFADWGGGIGPFELLFGFGLIAVGFMLLRDRADDGEQTRPVETTQTDVAGAGTTETSTPVRTVSTRTVAGALASVRTPRKISPLAPLTLALALVVVGVLTGFAENLNLDIGEIVAAGMMVLGGGLLVGAWWGRGRLLIIPAVMLAPVMVVSSLIDLPPRGAIGSRYIYADTVSQIEDSYELLLGDMTVDWSGIPSGEFGDRTLNLTMAAGRFILYLPSRIEVDVRGHLNAGEALVGNGRQEGVDLDLMAHSDGAPQAGSLVVIVDGGIGSLTIERRGNFQGAGGVEGIEIQEPDRNNKDKDRGSEQPADKRKGKGSN